MNNSYQSELINWCSRHGVLIGSRNVENPLEINFFPLEGEEEGEEEGE